MLMPVLGYIIFTKLLIISQCAPKLGPVSFDPLTSDINDPMLELPPPIPAAAAVLRSENKDEEPCQGYNFDENDCKLVNNRILCGYNKNIGEINNKEHIVKMKNGCHMRGDRIECGYHKKSVRQSPSSAPKGETFRMKLKAEALTLPPTETITPITSDIPNENYKETEQADTTAETLEPIIMKDLNSSILTDESDSYLSAETISNETVNITSNDSSTPLDLLETTTEVMETIGSESSTIQKTTVSEFTSEIADIKTESSLNTTVNKINININLSQNKTFCIEKHDSVYCYEQHVVPKVARRRT